MATHIYLPRLVTQSAPRARRILLLCVIAACLFLPFWFTNQLYANENQPDVFGMIAGVVRNTNGEPLAGLNVTLLIQYSYESTYWYIARTVPTEADGSYRFTMLLVGVYRVGVTDPQGRYGASFYPAANVVYSASDLPIAGNSVTGIDLTLQPAGQIIASVTVAPPYTATSSYLELRQRVETPGGVVWDYVQYAGFADSSGVFTFTGLAANSYRVCGSSYGSQFSAYECYDNVYALDKATDLPLTAGATISNVTLVLGDGANYAQVSGRVTDAEAKPLANIVVYALPIVNNGFAQAATSDTWTALMQHNNPLLAEDNYYGFLYTRTNSSGEYHLSTLQAGRYQVQFVDLEGTYAWEYYDDAHSLGEATVLAITERQVISNINAQLESGGQIAGRVTHLDTLTQNVQPAANTKVLAELKLADGSWQRVIQTDTNPNTGQYRLHGLPTGRYRISAQATFYNQDGYYQPYGVYGGSTLADAAEVPVVAGGSTEGIDITLHSLSFAGSIAGRVTANGAPIAGIKVALYRMGYNCCVLPPPVVYTFTDADGRYTFKGLTTATYVLGVSDPTGRYTTLYYPSQFSPVMAQFIFAQDQGAITDINLALTAAGSLSGHVQQRDGQAVAGLYVQLTRNTDGYMNMMLDSRTDSKGDYTVTGLPQGDYFVCFSTQPYYGYGECYGSVDSPNGSYGGTKVTVTAGKTTTGIDLLWGPDLRSYLPLVLK